MANHHGQEGSLYTYDSFTGNNTAPHQKNNFLWWCAGAHQALLKNHRSEQAKYTGLGGVILATFVLAVFSAGYALYSVFANIGAAIGFGLIWGCIIFNFDRFLVSTMRKYGVSKNKQLWMTIPRLALALLIGITIARPLELKIFEKEIDTQVIQNLHDKILINDSLLQAENKRTINSATEERERMMIRKSSLEDTLFALQQAYVQEADGTGGSGQKGVNKLTQLKMTAYQQSNAQNQPELQKLMAGISLQDSILLNAKANIETKRKQYEAAIKNNIGFLERNKALGNLADKEPSVFWSSLLISLLIILIEVGPILSKLIMPMGPYDIALANEELTSMAQIENEMRKSKDLIFTKKKKFYEQQKNLTNELTEKMLKLQQKHIDEELDKWERGEWTAKDHRVSMDEVLRKIKERYNVQEEDVL
jgi:hypothetical protein